MEGREERREEGRQARKKGALLCGAGFGESVNGELSLHILG